MTRWIFLLLAELILICLCGVAGAVSFVVAGVVIVYPIVSMIAGTNYSDDRGGICMVIMGLPVGGIVGVCLRIAALIKHRRKAA